MTVYVDDMLVPARPAGFRGPGTPKWSHLFADTPAELAQAAEALGLKPAWLQYRGSHREHYDVTSSVRQRALHDLGATPLRYPADLTWFLERRREVCQCPNLPACRWGEKVSQ